jgi:hypothetical protein
MPLAPMSLIEKAAEFLPLAESTRVPAKTRGLYLLLKKQRARNRYEVVYVGMACGPLAGIRGRLRSHRRKKSGRWTHFSVFKVWDNVSPQVVRELEGIVRHFYWKDPGVNLAVQRRFNPMKRLARDQRWLRTARPGPRR